MRASKESTPRSPRRSKLLGDLPSVRTWRRRNDDSPGASRLAVRPLALSAAAGDSSRASQAVRETPPTVGLLQASGLVVLVCAGALAIFAGWGRTDLIQLAAVFAVVGIGLVVSSLWRQGSSIEAVPPGEETSSPRARSQGTMAPPWAALDQRVQRLVSQLEEVFENEETRRFSN